MPFFPGIPSTPGKPNKNTLNTIFANNYCLAVRVDPVGIGLDDVHMRTFCSEDGESHPLWCRTAFYSEVGESPPLWCRTVVFGAPAWSNWRSHQPRSPTIASLPFLSRVFALSGTFVERIRWCTLRSIRRDWCMTENLPERIGSREYTQEKAGHQQSFHVLHSTGGEIHRRKILTVSENSIKCKIFFLIHQIVNSFPKAAIKRLFSAESGALTDLKWS